MYQKDVTDCGFFLVLGCCFFSLGGIIYALSVVLHYKAGRSFKNTLCSLTLMHKDGGVKGTIIIIKKQK